MKLITINHAYIKVGTLDCLDYKVALYGNYRGGWNYFLDAAHRDMLTSVNEIKNICDLSFKPNIGDEIHVVPDCKLATADIRNSYKLKRKFDEGVCNVFSPIERKRFGDIVIHALMVIPNKNLIIATQYDYSRDDYNSRHSCESVLHTAINEAVEQNLIDESDRYCANNINYIDPSYELLFYVGHYNESYNFLLKGGNKKPNIYYENLPMKREECTADLLYITYKLGRSLDYGEGQKKFKMQLMLLSQYNWKDYPASFGTLFNSLLSYWPFWRSLKKHYSSQPKPIKEIVENDFGLPTFEKEKDRKLFSEFLGLLLQVGEKKFSTIEEFNRKLSTEGIDTNLASNFYNIDVRITPKKYGEMSV